MTHKELYEIRRVKACGFSSLIIMLTNSIQALKYVVLSLSIINTFLLSVLFTTSFLLTLFSTLITISPTSIHAQTPITVSLDISDTILRIQGYASPYANITFIENEAVIGTTQANVYGEFNKNITYESEGIHTVSFYSTDQNSSTSSTITITVAVYTHAVTTIEDILIPPTIDIDNPIHTTNSEEIITFSGQATPNTTITLISGGLSKQTQTLVTGNWKITFTGDQFTIGTHTAITKTQKLNGTLSENSKTITFKINEYIPPEPEPTPIPTPEETTETSKSKSDETKGNDDEDKKEDNTENKDTNIVSKIITKINEIINGNGNSEIEYSCNLHPYLKNFDYNGNCFIPHRTEEFVNTVTYWTKNWRETTTAIKGFFANINAGENLDNLSPNEKQKLEKEIKRCDLDNDNLCTLKDFSILLYYTNNIEVTVQTDKSQDIRN